MTEDSDNEKTEAEVIREMIVHLLRIYPVLSPTMLQGGLGPQIKPVVWKPILEQLEEEGVVVREQEFIMSPRGRHNQYTKLRLRNAA